MNPTPPLPKAATCCLFLDIDGTLVDFAPTPDEVRVDEPLRQLLRALDRQCGGAVALVSGRPIVDIDNLFEPIYLAAAGIHGCERRDALGHWRREPIEDPALEGIRNRLSTQLDALEGVWIENKGCALSIHFRLAPHLGHAVREAVAHAEPRLPKSLEILEGDCVIELKPRAYNKATAIESFMREAPFAGRIPVFIGDDHGDQQGLDAVSRMNGLAVRVGHRVATDWALPDPPAVRRWLETFLLQV
jgi:trehalose 6-phosphate phosphatase